MSKWHNVPDSVSHAYLCKPGLFGEPWPGIFWGPLRCGQLSSVTKPWACRAVGETALCPPAGTGSPTRQEVGFPPHLVESGGTLTSQSGKVTLEHFQAHTSGGVWFSPSLSSFCKGMSGFPDHQQGGSPMALRGALSYRPLEQSLLLTDCRGQQTPRGPGTARLSPTAPRNSKR